VQTEHHRHVTCVQILHHKAGESTASNSRNVLFPLTNYPAVLIQPQMFHLKTQGKEHTAAQDSGFTRPPPLAQKCLQAGLFHTS